MREIKVLIDQSGKVEDISTDSGIAYSTYNSTISMDRGVLLEKDHKQLLKKEGKGLFQSSKKYNLKLFSAGVYMLTYQNVEAFREIIIDEEYKGHDDLIKGYLINFYKDFSEISVNNVPKISFEQVHSISSSDPKCHDVANEVRKGSRSPDFCPRYSYLKNLVLPSR